MWKACMLGLSMPKVHPRGSIQASAREFWYILIFQDFLMIFQKLWNQGQRWPYQNLPGHSVFLPPAEIKNNSLGDAALQAFLRSVHKIYGKNVKKMLMKYDYIILIYIYTYINSYYPLLSQFFAVSRCKFQMSGWTSASSLLCAFALLRGHVSVLQLLLVLEAPVKLQVLAFESWLMWDRSFRDVFLSEVLWSSWQGRWRSWWWYPLVN